jgi:hypothetical protein
MAALLALLAVILLLRRGGREEGESQLPGLEAPIRKGPVGVPTKGPDLSGPQPTHVSKSSELTPSQVSFQATLLRVLEKHRTVCDAANGRTCYRGEPYFAAMQSSGRRELRLLALAFPEESLETAQKMLASTPPDVPDTEAALWLLAVLADRGNETAKGNLISIGLGGDAYAASYAVELAGGMSTIQYLRPVLLKRAPEGSLASIILLANFSDSDSQNTLKALSADETFVGTLANRALEMQTVRERDGWSSAFAEILSGAARGERSQWVWWALQTAARHPVPDMMRLMRERLDRSKGAYREKFNEENANRYADKALLDAAFERSLSSTFALDTGVDSYYSHVLLTYWTLGGELSVTEKGHLNHMGYGCDPKQRLEELLATGK